MRVEIIEEGHLEPWDRPELPDAGPAVDQRSFLGRVTAHIHDAPRVVDIRKYAREAGVALPSFAEHGGNAAVLAVNTTFHLESAGFAYLNAAGIEVTFRDDNDESLLNPDVACRVLGLMPTTRTLDMADVSAGGTLAFSFGENANLRRKAFKFDQAKLPDSPTPIADIGSLKLSLAANAGGTLFLSSKWKRPIVEAYGLNDWSARWNYHKDEDSFFRRDFDQWCFVVFDENFERLKFRVRLTCELWTGIVPRSVRSPWQNFEVLVER